MFRTQVNVDHLWRSGNASFHTRYVSGIHQSNDAEPVSLSIALRAKTHTTALSVVLLTVVVALSACGGPKASESYDSYDSEPGATASTEPIAATTQSSIYDECVTSAIAATTTDVNTGASEPGAEWAQTQQGRQCLVVVRSSTANTQKFAADVNNGLSNEVRAKYQAMAARGAEAKSKLDGSEKQLQNP